MRKVVDLPAAVMKAHNGLGWVVQAGYLLANSVPLEIAANFGLIRAITKEKSNIVPQNELGVGFNYYFNQHAVKLQAEVARIWFEDAMVKKNDDTRVRVQFQVLL
jgi:hypothetical protein